MDAEVVLEKTIKEEAEDSPEGLSTDLPQVDVTEDAADDEYDQDANDKKDIKDKEAK